MKKEFLEIGKIVNTHGLRGEIKVQPWCNTPDFLLQFKTLYFEDESTVTIESARVHKNCALMILKGVDTIEKSEKLKNKMLYMDKQDAVLPEGQTFVQDLIGCKVFDLRTQVELGTLVDILQNTRQDVYVIKGEKEILIPGVSQFVKEIDLEKHLITVETIEGLC